MGLQDFLSRKMFFYLYLEKMGDNRQVMLIFRQRKASLREALSVGRSVCMSLKNFENLKREVL